jgi:hypothetical protein
LRWVSCPSLERRLEWVISCVCPGLDPGLPDQRVVLEGVAGLDMELVGPDPARYGGDWLGEDGVHVV